jgi:hypothetical protein
MGVVRALVAVLVVAFGAAAVAASAPASIGAAAIAHPEPNDVDGDTILNELDNCPTTPNGAQINTDVVPGHPGIPGDQFGDACDSDDDNDGIADAAPDNCRVVYNPDQADSTPGDGHGDACPPVDSDGDGRFDEDDNCLQVANPDQSDLDGDDKGDACDRDDDNDRYDDDFDNCPVIWNPDQADLDGDKVGSACDPEESITGPPGTPAGPSPGGPGGPGTATADHDAPKVTVSVQRRQRLSDAGTALVVKATCSEACSLEAVVAADAKAARRSGLGGASVVLARGAWSLAGAGRTYVFARWNAPARKLRSGREVTAALRLTASDAAGNRRTVTRPVELRR